MKQYVKNLYSVQTEPDIWTVPSFLGQREAFHCCECGARTIVPVPPTGVDWELVANGYKAWSQKFLTRADRIIRDLEVMHGDNPVTQYFENELKMMVLDLNRQLGSQ